MSIVLDPAVSALLDVGKLVRRDLIRFDLPGKTVGYHAGGRKFEYNGLVYQPNRWLDRGSLESQLGNSVTARTIRFSNVPTANVDDAIASIETYNYINAPVITTTLAGDPEADQVVGVLMTEFYEINNVAYPISSTDDNGQRTVSIEIELEPLGRSARDSTQVKRTSSEQKFDNLATDEFFERASTVGTVPVEWGQVKR